MKTEPKEPPTFAEIWDSCVIVMTAEKQPLEIWRIAKATGLPEEGIMAGLIRETENRRGSYIRFRFPALPCAAITGIHNP